MSDLRSELEGVRDRFGRLTPTVVVEAATPEDAPLHSRFEWNDRVAGHKYRLDQARELIRSVRVEYISREGEFVGVRSYISVSREGAEAPEYVPLTEVAEDPVQRAIVLRAAEREWRSLFSKYAHLSEFLELVREDVNA